MSDTAPRARRSIALAVAASALLAALVYLPTLSYGFVIDDLHQIVDNPWIDQPGRWTAALVRGVWDFEGRRSSYYRPAMYALYALTERWFGPSPRGFHAVNVLVHALASATAAWLAGSLARRSGGALAPRAGWVAALAGVLFAVHPVHTEPVAWCAGLVDLGMGATFLASLALYVTSDDAFDVRYGLSIAAFGLAVLFKEPAVTLPVALVAYDALFRWRTRGVGRTLVRLIPFGAVLTGYLLARAHALGGLAPTVGASRIGLSHYLPAVPDLFARYVVKIVAPVGLNFWHVYEPPETWIGARGVAALLVAAGFGVLAVWSVRTERTIALALALLVIPLSPAFALGALNQGISNAFTERYLYLPSFGIVLAAGSLAVLAAGRSPGARRAVAALVGVAVVVATAGCLRRMPVWKDSLSLWSDAVRKTPDSAIARANHGFALLYAKRPEEGEAELAHARRLDPAVAEEWVAKGVLYAREGLDKKALLAFHTALALDPQCAAARFNLGVAYEQRGDPRAALAEYRRAVALEPANASYRNNLGIAWAQAGRMDLALEQFVEAARLEPNDAEIRANLERARSELADP